jgi:hypothetical protein
MKKNENNNKTRKNGPKGPLSQGTPGRKFRGKLDGRADDKATNDLPS